MRSAALVSGPSRSPTWPTSTPGSQCSAKTRSTSSRAPFSRRCSAPPGITSSAGWNSSRTRPDSRPRSMQLGQRQCGAGQRGGVHVVSARVGDPRDRAGPGVVGEVLDRQRVHVRAQGHQRPARAQVCGEAGAAVARELPAGLLDPGGNDLRGAQLRPGQLGVCVQVAAQVDEVVVVLVDDVRDHGGGRQRGRVLFVHVPRRLDDQLQGLAQSVGRTSEDPRRWASEILAGSAVGQGVIVTTCPLGFGPIGSSVDGREQAGRGHLDRGRAEPPGGRSSPCACRP